jgi:hypothetical protein
MVRTADSGLNRRNGIGFRHGCFLVLVLVGGACSRGATVQPRYINDFVSRSPVAGCDSLPAMTAQGFNVVDLVADGDSGFLMLAGLSRQLISYDRALRPRWEIDLEENGPNGVGSPESVAMVDDSIYIVDSGRHLVKLLDRRGRERNTIFANFLPSMVRMAGRSAFVMPTVIGGIPNRLLYRIQGTELKAEPLSPRTVAGVNRNAFVNMLAAATRPDRNLVVIHQFYVPEAYLWNGDEVVPFAAPVPDGARELFRHPRSVEREEDLQYLPVVALSTYVDASGDVVYLTRSGRHRSGYFEKALVRVDSTFHYVSSRLLPVEALYVAPLTRDSVVVVSNEGEWHRCEVP